VEFKSFSFADAAVEVKAEGYGHFSGYASTFGNTDHYGDVIAPGAFAKSILAKQGKIPIFFGHDEDKWIGFSTALAEDPHGLRLEGTLALKTSGGGDVFELLKAAQDSQFSVGLSIGFIPEQWTWDEASQGRTLTEIDLWETSITPFPANPLARVQDVKTARRFARMLVGLSAPDTRRTQRAAELMIQHGVVTPKMLDGVDPEALAALEAEIRAERRRLLQ
jgi:HK97 family phage prohead protease